MLQYAIHFTLNLQYKNKYYTLLLWPRTFLLVSKHNKVTYLIDQSCTEKTQVKTILIVIYLNFVLDAIGVIRWSTCERRGWLVQTILWLTVAYCHFNSKLQPDVEQNSPEIKTAYEARGFKAKQESWLTVTWHVRWWNYDALLQILHSSSCCAYTTHEDDPLWPTICLLLISTHVTSSLLNWVWSSALTGLLMHN